MTISNKPVILISAASGDIGYSAVRSAYKRCSVIGCDVKAYTPVDDLLLRFYQAPSATETVTYIDFITELIDKHKIDFFLPISEPEIDVVNVHRERLGQTGAKLLINDKFVVDTFLDKLDTSLFLKSLGIKVPKTALLQNYDAPSFGFPLIVKPRKGYGSRRLFKALTAEDLEYVRKKDNGTLIVQEYVGSEDEEYTTGIFSDGKNVSSISFKRRLGADGTTLEAILVSETRLGDLSRHIAEAINLKGFINLQSRRIENVYVPFEVNPRISGTLLFRKKFGFDDIKWWMDILCGRQYSYMPKYESGVAFRYYSEGYYDLKKKPMPMPIDVSSRQKWRK